MMRTETFLRANRLLALIQRVNLKRGILFKSRRYSLRLMTLYVEQEARLRRYLLTLIDNESRRVA